MVVKYSIQTMNVCNVSGLTCKRTTVLTAIAGIEPGACAVSMPCWCVGGPWDVRTFLLPGGRTPEGRREEMGGHPSVGSVQRSAIVRCVCRKNHQTGFDRVYFYVILSWRRLEREKRAPQNLECSESYSEAKKRKKAKTLYSLLSNAAR